MFDFFQQCTAFFAETEDTGVGNSQRYIPDLKDDMEQGTLDPGLGKFLRLEERSSLKETADLI